MKRKTQSWTCMVAFTAFASPLSLTPQSCDSAGKSTESKQNCSQQEQRKASIKIPGGRTLPHTTQTQNSTGERCCPFLRQTRVSGGKRSQSYLYSLAEKYLLCEITVCMLYPWPHPKYIFLDRHSLGSRASRIQCLAQRGSILGGLLRTTINTISNNNPRLSYWRYF